MRTMAHDEALAFLAFGTRTGKLAMVRANGAPIVTPVWFVIDGDDLVFTTWHESAKAKRLHRDPRATLIVDMEEPPYAYVRVDGTVSFSGDLEEVRRFATIIGGRYMGVDRAEEYGRRNGVEGELVARLGMDRVVGHHDLSG
jgi:PPOX class probable F420-dependent enzyme